MHEFMDVELKNVHFTENFQTRKTAPFSGKLQNFLCVKVKEKIYKHPSNM